jgi:hypothetical protein
MGQDRSHQCQFSADARLVHLPLSAKAVDGNSTHTALKGAMES